MPQENGSHTEAPWRPRSQQTDQQKPWDLALYRESDGKAPAPGHTRPLVESVRSDGKTAPTPRRPQETKETKLRLAGLRRAVSMEKWAPGQAAHPWVLGDLDHPPLLSAGRGRCRAGGHSAARAQDPRQRPGCWGEPRPKPPSVPRAQGPQTPVQGPEGHGGFREHGRENPACHGELWQSRLRTVAARDHQTLPDAKAPMGLTRRLGVGI